MPEDGIVHVYMGVQGEEGFPHEGTINFVNNQVNSTTGSISVRGVFPNPKPEHGAPTVVAWHVRGAWRCRSANRIDRSSLLTAQSGSDQGLKFVYVVDAENRANSAASRPVHCKMTACVSSRAASRPTNGSSSGRFQQVRARMEIRPERIPMPTMPRPTIQESTPPKSPSKAADQQPAKENSGSKDRSGSRTPANKKRIRPAPTFRETAADRAAPTARTHGDERPR